MADPDALRRESFSPARFLFSPNGLSFFGKIVDPFLFVRNSRSGGEPFPPSRGKRTTPPPARKLLPPDWVIVELHTSNEHSFRKMWSFFLPLRVQEAVLLRQSGPDIPPLPMFTLLLASLYLSPEVIGRIRFPSCRTLPPDVVMTAQSPFGARLFFGFGGGLGAAALLVLEWTTRMFFLEVFFRRRRPSSVLRHLLFPR